MTLLLKAISFAAEKHAGQTRGKCGGNGAPYLVHTLAVADTLSDAGYENEALLCAAVLHDVVEDTDATIREVAIRFGECVGKMVAECTDDPKLSKDARKAAQLRKAQGVTAEASVSSYTTEAALIKLADKIDNVRSLVSSPPPWKTTSVIGYAETCARIVRCLTVSLRLRGERVDPLAEKFLDAYRAVVDTYGGA